MDNRKNTILLTVIAVATLLVAVVGATFAYFTAQGGDTKSANVTVTTDTADSSSFTAGNLYLNANMLNFNIDSENNVSTNDFIGQTPIATIAESKAEYTASTSYGDAGNDMCYTVTLKVTSNGFKHGKDAETAKQPKFNAEDYESEEAATTAQTKFNQGPAELVFQVSKTPKGGTKHTYSTVSSASEITGLDYVDAIGGKVNTTTRVVTPRETVSGFDITSLANGAEFVIPDENGEQYHRLHSAKVKAEDVFEASVTFINYEWDQEYNAGPELIAKLEFEKMDTCPAAH